LIAGPITHHKEIIPQFQSMRIFKPQPLLLTLGATIFLVRRKNCLLRIDCCDQHGCANRLRSIKLAKAGLLIAFSN
jgi:hypothetical protein